MSLSQNDMGRAFEYGIATSLSEHLSASIEESLQVEKARNCFELALRSDKLNIMKAATDSTAFLVNHDHRLSTGNCSILLQPDRAGMLGDVRDIVVHNRVLHDDVGISAKHRHFAVKHSRLSQTIDFGSEWFGIRCSDSYFQHVSPIFEELSRRRLSSAKWRDIPNKKQLFYMPILHAFHVEVESLFKSNPNEVAKRLVQYLLGTYDYYKVIKENGSVSIMSFNIRGSLRWGSRLPLPSRVIEISQKPESETTLIMTFDHGWQISFRIHNASTMVEPSLKFDINIIGLPSAMSRNVIEYVAKEISL